MWLLVPAGLTLAAFLLYRALPSGGAAWLAFFAFFAVANAAVPDLTPSPFNVGVRRGLTPALYITVVNSLRAVGAADPDLANARLWFDEKEIISLSPGRDVAMGNVAYPFGGFVWDYLAEPSPLPSVDRIPDADLVWAGQHRLLVIVPTNRPQTITELAARFAAAGGTIKRIERVAVGVPPFKLELYLLQVGIR
ncbi:MAG: hypothetical protein ACRELF_22445 [Gemmataceae bacterium]